LRDTRIDDLEATLASDQWFKRGWTLQELLAPDEASFYDKDWCLIGNKKSLFDTLSSITGIEKAILRGTKTLSECSIAQRMSWAWDRKTSRAEDIAYCLLGIFDVNMPLLYGERGKAFIRLQEEIIRQSSDESIFAWYDKRIGFVEYRKSILADERWSSLQTCNQGAAAYVQEQVVGSSTVIDHSTAVRSQSYLREEQPQFASNMLAKHPEGFRYAGQIHATTLPTRGLENFSLTNRGLTTKTSLIPWSPNTYLLLLACYTEGRGLNIGILLRRLSRAAEYARVQVAGEQLIEDGRCIISYLLTPPLETVYIPRSVQQGWLQEEFVYGFHISIPSVRVRPPTTNGHGWHWTWNKLASIVYVDPGFPNPADICDIYLDKPGVKIKTIRLGFDRSFVPFFMISRKLIKDWRLDVRTMSDEDRVLHSSKWFHQSSYTSGTCLHSVEGQPGLWIVSNVEVTGNYRSFHLFEKGNTKAAVATIELKRCFMRNNDRWSIWTFAIPQFTSTASSKTAANPTANNQRPGFVTEQIVFSPSDNNGRTKSGRSKINGISGRLASILRSK